MEIRLLGPLEVRDGERAVALPRRQQRALLAALALRTGEVVSTERLIADLWGERAPASATGSLQNTVAALRKTLGRDLVLTQAPGYRLTLEPASVDAHRFERLLAAARGAEEAATRAELLNEALALWRGPALADLDEEQFARLEGGRLDELRVGALEERIDADLALGRHAALVGELEALVAAHPLRERLREQLMIALYRCGRQAEALEIYRAFRLALLDELGLEPSARLQALERKMLLQDPEIEPPGTTAEETAPTEVERRLVTVLAATPPDDDDPERLRRRLDDLLATVRDVLARYDGELERFGPEGLVAVFGAHAPRDDDALRAVRAAGELGLPAGVATGESVSGAGAVFTRASELARGTGVQTDERTRALVEHERRLDAPLVGRTEELRRLRSAFDAATAERRCRVVTVLGEPGIGKTRLGRELVESVTGAAETLVGRCVSYGKGLTFLPLVDALRGVDVTAALVRDSDAELASTRLAALDGATDAGTLGESYWAVRRLLEALGRTRPVLLLLDDVHWAEPGLLDLVEYLGERVTETPLLLVNLARPELERPVGEQIALGPLSDDEARELVTGIAELGEETVERVVALAEGNALYAEQLASFAAEGGGGLPPTLEAVLAGRLGRLGDSERAVLQRAAVAGREFSRGVVAALSEQPVDGALASLSRRSFIHPAGTMEPGDDGYRFHHVLLRDTAYSTLTRADRAALHERTAEWLDRDGPGDDALAGYHLEQATLSRRELGEDADELAASAGERLGQAGMRVWRTNDVAAAAGLLDRAIALLPTGARRAELLCERAITLRLQDRAADANSALDEAERVAAASRAAAILARVTAERTQIRLLSGELALDDAIAAFADARRTLGAERDERGLGRAELLAGSVHWLACNLAAAGESAERAAAHYVAAGFSPAGCIATHAEALYYGATPVESASLACARLLERSPDRMTEANITAILGGLRALAGDADDARSLLAHARELFEDVGNRRGLWAVWTPYRIDAELAAGDLAVATTLARECFEALSEMGERGYATSRAVDLAELLLLQGEDHEADRVTGIAERDALPSDVSVQFLHRGLRARLLARAGSLEAALALARDAVTIASMTDSLRYRARAHVALADVLTQAGQADEARAEEAVAEDLLRRKGVKGALIGAPSTS